MQNTIKILAKWIYPVSSPPIEDGVIIIKNGNIVTICKKNKLPNELSDHVITLPHHIIMPGLINSHAHLELSDLRNKISGSLPFTQWIKEVIKYTKTVAPKRLLEATSIGLENLINHGTTTVANISILIDSFEIFNNRKIRGKFFFEVLGFKEKDSEEIFNNLKSKIKNSKKTDLIGLGVAPHSLYSVSPGLIKKVYDLSKNQSLPVTMHIAETKEEIHFLKSGEGEFKKLLLFLNKWDKGWKPPGCSPICSLNKDNALADLLSVHCNHLCPSDISLLKKKNSSVVFCPLSNLWFKRKMPYQLCNLLKAGINVCLGTDGLSSNNDLNLFNEMKEIKRLFPHLQYEQIIEMSTQNGAYALGLANITGELKPGLEADLIALNAKDLLSVYDMAEYIVSRKDKVILSMVKGNILKNNLHL